MKDLKEKQYSYMWRARGQHIVRFYDGQSTHGDGSPFYDMRICKNKRELARVLSALRAQGYLES